MSVESSSRWSGRLMLIGLFALFFMPVVAAIVSFVVNPGWLPFGTVNRGQLIRPPRLLEIGDVALIGENATLAAKLAGHWAVLHTAPASCPDPCSIRLTAMKQARLALGKDAERVVRVWLVSGRPDTAATSVVLSRFPGLMAVNADAALSSQLPEVSSDAIYILDPSRLLILRYGGDDAAKAMLTDLKRLLKISKQG